jgi:hypothetical protein
MKFTPNKKKTWLCTNQCYARSQGGWANPGAFDIFNFFVSIIPTMKQHFVVNRSQMPPTPELDENYKDVIICPNNLFIFII